MADISALSDDDLKAAYAGASSSPISKMSDDDLKAAYERSASPGGLSVRTGALWTGPDADAWASAAQPMAHVLGAFGQGAATAWEHGENLGYSDDVNDWMKKVGVYSDVAKGQGGLLRTYNEAMIRPIVSALFGVPGALMRGFSSAMAGGQAATEKAGEEVGMPGLGRDIAAIPEAFPLFGAEHGLHGAPHGPLTAPEVGRAAELGVIGKIDRNAVEGGPAHAPVEDFPMGSVTTMRIHPTATQEGEGFKPYTSTLPPDVAPAAEAQPATEAPPRTIHDAAREAAPETFSEYDALNERKADLRAQIADRQAELQRQADAQAPHAAEIADLRRRMEDTTPRLAKKYQARLDEILPQNEAFAGSDAEALLLRPTPEIEAMRQQLQEADYRMRDLAPDVTAAYRGVAKEFPEEVESPPEEIGKNPQISAEIPGESTPKEITPASATGNPVTEQIQSVTPAAEPVPAEEPNRVSAPAPAPINIAADVSRKLQAAGRPVEDADAAGAVQDALWRTRAAAFEGRKGTAEEMYAREAPDIRAGKEKARALELAQKGREYQQGGGEEAARTEFPKDFPEVVIQQPDSSTARVRARADYKAAKAGDMDAAMRLVSGSIDDAKIEQVLGIIGGRKPSIVSVHSEEAAGRNKIPQAYAEVLADRLDLPIDDEIVHASRPQRTGSSPLHRITTRSAFDGQVEAGRDYLIVDDHVSQGGTLADLRAYIESKGGHVIGATTLTGNDSSAILSPARGIADRLRQKFPGLEVDWKEAFGHGFDGLTNSEAAYLERHNSADSVRNTVIARRQESSLDAGEGVARGAEGEGGTRSLDQSAQGKISLTEDGRSVITLFKSANASTFLHETGHDWLERMMRDAVDPEAPSHMATDAATVRKYLGNDGGALTTAQHEKFARSFERYFMEGRAPSAGLARVFEQFRQWLTSIYQTVAKLRAPITDDIRDVFDRLLAEPKQATIALDHASEGREMVGHAAPERSASPYEAVPAEPKRLINFLRESQTQGTGIHATTIPGGLKDTGGDVAAIVGGPKGRPGLINNKSGLSLDDATLRAHEAGYFPEHGQQRPEINHLLDAISEDHRGNARYSMHDEEVAQAYRDALAHNSEIDRLADRHGIDPNGLTREQFYDKITDKLSAEEAQAEIRAQEDAHEIEFNDVDAEVRDIPDAHDYSSGEPRTLEDLENAYRQETTARAAGEGAPVGGGPGPAAGPEGQGEASGEPRGRGAGTAGRDGAEDGAAGRGAETAGRPDESAKPTPPGSDELVDKAGNIRLDNLNSDDDVKQVLRDLAKQNDDFMIARGGVVSVVQRREMADGLGLTPGTFDAQKPPGVSPSVWAEAVQKLTFQASDEAARLGKTFGESGSPADAAAYLAAKQRLLMIADHFSTLTAEAGRTLQVFDKRGMSFTGDMVAKMEQDTGKTLFQMQQEAKAVGAMETTAQRAKMMQDTREPTRYQKVRSGIISYFINNLISGPITHAGYSVGNEVWALFKAIPLTAAEATIDTARAAFGAAPVDRVYYGEIGAQIYGMMRGMRDGFVPGVEALKTGISYMEGAERLAQDAQGQLPGMSPLGEATLRQSGIAEGLKVAKVPEGIADKVGYVLETPSRVVSAIHTVFYAMNYERDIARRAFRTAANEGLTGSDFATRVAELTQDPPREMVEAAHQEALDAVLMRRPAYGGNQQKFVSIINDSLPLKLAMPFMQIGMNILDEGLIKTTPIGLASQAVRDNLFGRNGEVARTQQYARIMVGSGLTAGIMGLAAQGLLTGGGPSDPKALALKEAEGWKAYSIKIGDTYVPYRKYLGPLGPLVGAAANIHDVAHLLSEGQVTKAAGAAVLGFTEVVANETWMSGLSKLIDATRHYDTKGERYIRDLALDFMPLAVGTAQSARIVDRYQREVHSWTAAALNKIPFASQSLYPQRDWTGAEIDSHTMMSPSFDRRDKTMQAMEAVEFYPAKLPREIGGVPLTDKQYDDYARISGHLAKLRLDMLVRTPGFTQQPAGFQQKTMSETLSGARKSGSDWVKLQPDNANIVRQSIAAKQAQVQGKPVADVRAARTTAQ